MAIYGILCAISIALYELIQIFVEDKSTATNLLIWSATMFAPIEVFVIYTSWKNKKVQSLYFNNISILMQLIKVENKYNILKNIVLVGDNNYDHLKKTTHLFDDDCIFLKKSVWF